MIHEIIPVGWLQCNCHILGDEERREAIIIDPGDEVDRILALVRKHRLTVKQIVNTHAHPDHVGGLRELREITGAPVLMHADDLVLYQNLERFTRLFGMPAPPLTEVDAFLRDGDRVRCGAIDAQVLHTPGHTQGSICLYLPDDVKRLFAGDTLFLGSIGRTDLWGGSPEAILRSIKNQLLVLDDETRVFPGHGPATTIGQERERNPFLERL